MFNEYKMQSVTIARTCVSNDTQCKYSFYTKQQQVDQDGGK